MAMKGLAHAAFSVPDIGKAEAYYCGQLKMEKLFTLKLGNGSTLVYLRFAPRQFLELFYGEAADQTPYGNTGSFEHICIEVDGIEEMYADYLARGVAVDGPPAEGADGNMQMWLTDPFGNRIELMQYGAHPLQFSQGS